MVAAQVSCHTKIIEFFFMIVSEYIFELLWKYTTLYSDYQGLLLAEL